MKRIILLSAIIFLASRISFAQISIGGLPYIPATTNFNSYNPTPVLLLSTLPSGWTGASSSTSVYNGQGIGTSNTGGYWGYGTAGDFSLGALRSGTTGDITYAVSFTNNSGTTITSITLNWDYEQWRFINTSGWNCSGTGGLAGNATLNAADFTGSGTGTNGTPITTAISLTLSPVSITSGTTFGISWITTNVGGSDNGISIDNFSIVASTTAATDYFRSKQNGNWNAVSTWQSSADAVTWVNASLTPTNTANTITVQSPHTVTVTSSVSIDQTTVNSGGQVSVNAGQTLTIVNGAGTDLTVDGTVVNSGTITPTGTIQFNATGIYQHAQNGGVIPASTWNVASNCNITGITGNAPTGLTQTFGNFTWNCGGHTTIINLNGNLQTIKGNFNVIHAGFVSGTTYSLGLSLTGNTNFTLTVDGDMNISTTTNATWLNLTDGSAIVTVNVGGNVNFTGASSVLIFHFIQTSTTMNQITMNVTGNFTQTDSYLDWAYGTTTGGTIQSIMNLGGNFIHSGNAIMITSTTDASILNGKIVFNKTGSQTLSVANPANLVWTNFEIASGSITQMLSSLNLQSDANPPWGGKFTVNSGGILDAGTNQIISSSGLTVGTNNDFTLNSGAGIITANPFGVHQIGFAGPSISAAIATRTFSSGANFTYNATVLQVSGTFVTTPTANQVNNFTVNNTAGNTTTGVTLQQAFMVANILTLTSGHITSTSTNLLTMNAGSLVSGQNYGASPRQPGGSFNSYVNGPMRKIGNTNFLFPLGKVNNGNHFCGISSPALVTDTYTAEYIRGSATLLGGISIAGLSHVSNCDYWTIATTAASPNSNVTLSWNGNSNCNLPAGYVNDLNTLVIAHFGTSWDLYGGLLNTDPLSTTGSGSITWNGVTTFSPFSLGSTSNGTNPLPVKLVNVRAYRSGDRNKIEWTNLTEADVVTYVVERSVNGTLFEILNAVAPRSNANDKIDYLEYDMQVSPVTYYRIKVISLGGRISYSPVVKVVANGQGYPDLIVYPNPVSGKQFTLQMNSPAGNYQVNIYAANGQLIKTEALNLPGGSFSKTIELPGQLQAGLYLLQVTGGEKILTSKLIIQ